MTGWSRAGGGVVNGAPAGALGIPGRVRPGEWLRNQRVAAGLTQEDLAERSGVSVRAIADLERGLRGGHADGPNGYR